MSNKDRAIQKEADFLSKLSPQENLKRAICSPSHGSSEYCGDSIYREGLMWRDAEMTRKAGNWILESNGYVGKRTTSIHWGVVAAMIALTIAFVLMASISRAETQINASWYSEWALKRDGQWAITHGRTASGQLFADSKLTGASWKYFGKTVRITRTDTKASVVVLVNDKTARRFAETRIDLSPAAFSRIAGLNEGIVPVIVEVI